MPIQKIFVFDDDLRKNDEKIRVVDRFFAGVPSPCQKVGAIQSFLTPYELILELLSNLDLELDSTIAVLNLEFAVVLNSIYGIPFSQIHFIDEGQRDCAVNTAKMKVARFIGIPQENIHQFDAIKDAKMKFDFVVGNPPYQESTSFEDQNQAKPLYHKFVKRFTDFADVSSMVIPSAWFQSTVNELADFREFMQKQNITHITDFVDSKDAFKNVDKKGGVCFYLIQNNKPKNTTKYRRFDGKSGVPFHEKFSAWEDVNLNLTEYIFVRNSIYYSVIGKLGPCENMSAMVHSQENFGIASNSVLFRDEGDYTVYVSRQKGNIKYIPANELPRGHELVQKHKVFITAAAEGAQTFPNKITGRCFYGAPGSVCSASFLVAGEFDTKEEAHNLISYLNTKFVRFLISSLKITQNTSKKVYRHVPIQNWKESWSDEKLYRKYNLTQEEINKIEEMILPV